ncbi:uncharacterized protein LOC117646578 [Thrips palmi]|uniref:Uncharacterized protein LOC117646578 n=1 Tax=Thrips palmi TaxID=161013 RepID=A0A6P8Z935_THRPL|nr:uncharacterized protein LOC117646578 [Thrips palmi]
MGCGKTDEAAISNAKEYAKRLMKIHDGEAVQSEEPNPILGDDWDMVARKSQVPGLYDEVIPQDTEAGCSTERSYCQSSTLAQSEQAMPEAPADAEEEEDASCNNSAVPAPMVQPSTSERFSRFGRNVNERLICHSNSAIIDDMKHPSSTQKKVSFQLLLHLLLQVVDIPRDPLAKNSARRRRSCYDIELLGAFAKANMFAHDMSLVLQ